MAPAFVRLGGKRNIEEGTPLRAFGFPDQGHAGFVRKAVSLAGVAGDTGANDVLPVCQSAAVAGHDMVEIQHFASEGFSTILTGVVVTLEDIVAGELHFLLRQTLEEKQNDDSRNANTEGDRVNHFAVRIALGKIPPAFEIVREKSLAALRADNLGMALVEQCERAARAASVHRLPKAVENKNRSVEDGLHRVLCPERIPDWRGPPADRVKLYAAALCCQMSGRSKSQDSQDKMNEPQRISRACVGGDAIERMPLRFPSKRRWRVLE